MSGRGNAGGRGERSEPAGPAETGAAASENAAKKDGASGPGDAPDIALACGPTDDGEGVRILRRRREALELGELRALKEGQPIHGEVVRLRPRGDHPRLLDVEVLLPRPTEAPGAETGRGPAQVATESYRDNWERIFGAGPAGAPN